MASPTPAPVSLCLIVKNEPRLREHLTPLRPWVKQIAVLDTGSTPERVAELRTLEAEGLIDTLRIGAPGEFDFHGVPIDFAKARNASFDLTVEPWILWMDGDDEIVGMEKLPAIIAEYEGYRQYNPGAEFEISFPYEYNYDEQGRCDLLVERGRLYSKRSAWRWCWVVHESICVVPNQPFARFSRDDIVWKHRRKEVGKSGDDATKRNWALFEKYWQHEGAEGPVDARMALYTAMTLQDHGRSDDAAVYFRLALDHFGIDEDVMVAALRYAGLLVGQKKLREALIYAFMAVRAKLEWSQGWLAVTLIYKEIAEEEKWQHRRTLERLVGFGKIGLAASPSNWFGDPRDRLQVCIAMSIAYDQMGRYPEALEVCELGLKDYPDDPTLASNRDIMVAVVEENRMVAMANRLKQIRSRGAAHERVVSRLAGRLSDVLGPWGPPSPAGLPAQVLLPLREDGKLRIVFACGNSWQPWNPDIVASPSYRGGGSEVAVVEISKRLAALGHEVIVATDCGEPKVYEGVTWVPSDYLSVAQKTDVLIAWRVASHVDFPIAARLRVLWLHDVIAHGATEANLARFDKLVVLSKYHRDVVHANHPSLNKEKLEIIRSGADAKRFALALPRDTHKAVWTSSPDRGLRHLLELWPEVRKRVEDAELHIFYGWDMWERMGTDPMGLMHVQHLVRSLKDQGVVYRERVSADQLAIELLGSGVWAYPCTFPEIFCVAGIEAQMAGLRCIVNPIGALAETVLDGARLPGDPGAPDVRAEWVDTIALAMRTVTGGDRQPVADAAQACFDLEPLGEIWEHRLKSWLAGQVEMPVYESALAAAE